VVIELSEAVVRIRDMLPMIALAFSACVPVLLAGLVTTERWSAAR